jgi:hypothetical protein
VLVPEPTRSLATLVYCPYYTSTGSLDFVYT